MKENKVLFILENFYGPRLGRTKLHMYALPIRMINPRNATYSRILKHFKDTEFKLYFGETTPLVGLNKNQKFEVDLEWIKETLKSDEWFAVIACCKKAEEALKEIKYEPFRNLPHPVSRKWRKQMIVDCVKDLNEKLKTMK